MKDISLYFESDVISSMIILFSVLDRVQSSKEIRISDDGKAVYIREKEVHELLKLDFDYSALKEKIFDFFNGATQWLHLNSEESKIFRKCSHAAYYFLLEEDEKSQKSAKVFIDFHERLFKNDN